MKKCLTFAMFLLGFCQHSLADQPPWISHLPSESGKVFALGIAPLDGGTANSLILATNRARAELVASLRASVTARTDSLQYESTDTLRGTNASAQARVQSTVSGEARNLSGIVLRESHVSREDNTVYVLAVYDAAAEISQVTSGLRSILARTDAEQLRVVPQGTFQALKEQINDYDQKVSLLSAYITDPTTKDLLNRAKQLIVDRARIRRSSFDFKCIGYSADVCEKAIFDVMTGAGFNRTDSPEFTIVITDVGSPAMSKSGGFIVRKANLVRSIYNKNGLLDKIVIKAKGLGASDAEAESNLFVDMDDRIAESLRDVLGI